jgi:hypothetical protein
MISSFLIRRLKLYLFVSGVFLSLSVEAQQYNDPGILQNTIVSKPADYSSNGIRLGGFMLNPGVELVYENSDNVFYSEKDPAGDSVFHLRPWANLKSNWSRHQLNLNVKADLGRHSTLESEDYTDLVFALGGRIDIKRSTFLGFEAVKTRLHEERTSPDDAGGIEPNQFKYDNFNISLDHTFNRLQVIWKLNRSESDYDNNLDGNHMTINNNDRDYTKDTSNLRLQYDLKAQGSVFLGLSNNTVRYDQLMDDHGFQRDSDGTRIQGGMKFDLSGLLSGSVYLERMNQDPVDLRFDSYSANRIGAGFSWTPRQTTNVLVEINTGPQETTQIGTSSYLSTLYAMRVQHELRHNLLLHARISYTDNEYQHNDQPLDSALHYTDISRIGIGTSYLVNRKIALSGGFVIESQDSNLAASEYSSNRFFLSLRYEL